MEEAGDWNPVDQVIGNRDILKEIFQLLPIKDLCASAAVNRAWREVSEAEEFWSALDFEHEAITLQQVFTFVLTR